MQNRKRDTEVQNRLWDTVGEGEGVMFRENSIETCIFFFSPKHVSYQGWNRSPAQVGCMRQVLGAGALGRRSRMGWGERWEVGSGWGIHVNPWLIHVNVWQKPLQYCKVISLQLIKINGEKKKKRIHLPVQATRDSVRALGRFHILWGSWACVPQLLSRACAPQHKKPAQWEDCALQLERSPHSHN